MEITQGDLHYGLRALDVSLDRVTVTNDEVQITFPDEVDVYRFWVRLAQSSSARTYVNYLLDNVTVDETPDGRIVLEFPVRVTGVNGQVSTQVSTAGSASGDAGTDERLARVEDAIQRLTRLAEQHLGARF